MADRFSLFQITLHGRQIVMRWTLASGPGSGTWTCFASIARADLTHVAAAIFEALDSIVRRT